MLLKISPFFAFLRLQGPLRISTVTVASPVASGNTISTSSSESTGADAAEPPHVASLRRALVGRVAQAVEPLKARATTFPSCHL